MCLNSKVQKNVYKQTPNKGNLKMFYFKIVLLSILAHTEIQQPFIHKT